MFAIAARRMGYRVHVLSPDNDTPTGQVADVEIQAAYDDMDAVADFARRVEVITFEFENVPVATTELAGRFAPVRPAGSVLHTTQNRLRGKGFSPRCRPARDAILAGANGCRTGHGHQRSRMPRRAEDGRLGLRRQRASDGRLAFRGRRRLGTTRPNRSRAGEIHQLRAGTVGGCRAGVATATSSPTGRWKTPTTGTSLMFPSHRPR